MFYSAAIFIKPFGLTIDFNLHCEYKLVHLVDFVSVATFQQPLFLIFLEHLARFQERLESCDPEMLSAFTI